MRRPRLHFGGTKVRLRRAYLRLRNHAIGPAEVTIERHPFDFTRELVVVEHLRGQVTMVRDEEFRLAPIWSGLVLQNRNPDGTRKGRNGAQ